jgi:3-deoxy-D-manno-octulosonic-acid transferase
VSERMPATLRTYRLLTQLAAPLAPLLLKHRLHRGKEDAARMSERRGLSCVPRPAGALVWLHGASVGELTAALPLIENIFRRGLSVLVTTGTVTSARLAKQRLPAGVIHQFVPLDAPLFVRRFLDHWKPDLALFMESDLWPNLIEQSAQREIPLVLINGRLSERSFERWRRFPNTIEAILRRFDLCLIRSAAEAAQFNHLGALRLVTTGNLKLDAPPLPVDEAAFAELSRALVGRVMIAAASTHSGEDEAIFEVHRRIKATVPGLLTIIAPRHPERGAEIARLAEAAELKPVLRSAGGRPDRMTDIYICDTVGELGLIYRLTPIVFMGGSLVSHGGQNPIEAIRFDAAILHGPFVSNFTDIYDALDRSKGAALVADADALATNIAAWLSDPAARQRTSTAAQHAVEQLGGALQRTLAALDPYFMQLRLQGRHNHA